jgi:hypothetical protein
MKPLRGAVLAFALVTLAAAGKPIRADEGGVFQKCCHRCRARACYAPPCAPVTVRCRCRCGPIRRLFGRCCRAPAPSCYVCPPPCPPAPCVSAPVVTPAPVAPPPDRLVAPPPPAPSYRLTPPPEPAGPPPEPPVMGSKYQPARPVAPAYPQRLTPSVQGPPVRLDRFVSYQKK